MDDLQNKRLAWEMIKSNAPDLAGFISLVSERFGKPAAIEAVFVETGEVVKVGEFKRQHPRLNLAGGK